MPRQIPFFSSRRSTAPAGSLPGIGAVEFRQVTKRYRGGGRGDDGPLAVDSVTFTAPAGETTVLLGSSGCGKTTLLRMVNAMVQPTSGHVVVDGHDVANVDPVWLRRSIGYVIQHGGLAPHHSVLDNAATVPRLWGRSRDEARDLARQALTDVGLASRFHDAYPDELSGGQAQRVGVARALAANAGILLLDEPFGAIDPIVRRDLQQMMQDIQDHRGCTVLLVTHDVDEALTLGTTIVVLREGAHIAQLGTPAELLAAPADDFVATMLGVAAGDARRGTARRQLHVRHIDGHDVVVDGHGRALGTVTPERDA